MEDIFIFDVDGVLCDSGQKIEKEFMKYFLNWSKGKNYVLITGSELEKTIEQIGSKIVNRASIVFNCIGNSIYMHGKKTVYNQFTLKDKEYQFLLNKVADSKFPYKTGNHIVQREGSLNFSVVGRNASIQHRNLYKHFDYETDERKKIRKSFLKRFPRFEAFIGGETSIDICLRGANKGLAYQLIPKVDESRLHFFADKAYPNGIDEPFALCVYERDVNEGHAVYHVTGYKETLDILKSL